MPNIDELLFHREYFPIEVMGPFIRRDGKQYYDLRTVIVPPYHPSMLEEGVDFKVALSLLGETVRETIADLEGVEDKRTEIRMALERLTPDQRTGEMPYGEVKMDYGEYGEVHQVPLVYGIQILKDGLHFLGSSAECTINPYFDDNLRQFRTNTVFPDALLQEYGMRDLEPEKAGKEQRWVEGTHFWHRHNVRFIQDVFSKNFAIAYDNSVVRRKYGQR